MANIKSHIVQLFCLLFAVLACAQQPAKSHVKNTKADTLLYSDGLPIRIGVKNGKIDQLSRTQPKNTQTVNPIYVAPGFIDHQVNGYLSHSFVDPNLDESIVRKITERFQENGITTFLPTLTSESSQVFLKNLGILNEILKNEDLGHSIPGFHLEGPYISPLDGFRGAHNATHIRDPDWDEFSSWHKASGQRIKLITIAPELNGSEAFIKNCIKDGILVALGHTNANAGQINTSVALGASLSTHLGNGCANTIHRHNNPIWPQLANDGLVASLIADGFHLTREEVRTFYKAKGSSNITLVSDLTRWAGMPPGNYQDFDQEVVVTQEGAIMMPSENVLAGASFLIVKGIENMMAYTGCSLAEAIDMASKNPAKLLNLQDRGEIAIGKWADLVYFTLNGGKLEIVKTVVQGKVVYQSSPIN